MTATETKIRTPSPKYECVGGPLDGEFRNDALKKREWPSGKYIKSEYTNKDKKVEDIFRWIPKE